MNKITFLTQLREQLAPLPEAEREKTLSFYEEGIADRIEEGMSEQQAVESLGSVEEIATEILLELPLATVISSQVKQSHQAAKHKKLWIVLAIIGFPIWFFLLLMLLGTIVSVYFSVWSVIASLVLVQASLLVAGLFGLISGIATIFYESFTLGMMKIGLGMGALGFVIATTLPLFWLIKQFILLTGKFLKQVKRLLLSKSFPKKEG